MANNEKQIRFSYTPPKSIAKCIDNNIKVIAKKDAKHYNNVITQALRMFFNSEDNELLCRI